MLRIRKTVLSACLSSFHNIGSLAATFSSTVNKDNHNIKIETPGRAEGTAAAVDDARREERRSSSVGDSLREGAARAMETGMELGEKAKQTMDDAWDNAAKETTKNVKDAMGEDQYDDDAPPSDRHVNDLRKRSGGGYDLRDNRH